VTTDPSFFKRLHRYERPNQARALNFSCIRNEPVLTSPQVRAWFYTALDRALATHPVHLWAYCLMATHVHMLVYPHTATPNVGRFLDAVKRSTSQQALAHARRSGHPTRTQLWQPGGGYDRNLVTSESIWEMIDYIHLNPVAAKLCQHPTDWPDSSARRYDRDPTPIARLDLSHLPPRHTT